MMASKWLPFEGFSPQRTFEGLKGRERGEKDGALLLPGLQVPLLQRPDDVALMCSPSLQQLERGEQQEDVAG